MNIQAMMKQAQALQKNMMKEKEEIDNKTYSGKSSFVEVEVKGNKKIEKIKINKDKIEEDEVELVEDLLCVALNDAMKKIDEETNSKLGKYTKGMPGLF